MRKATALTNGRSTTTTDGVSRYRTNRCRKRSPGGGDSYRRRLEGRYKCVAKRTRTLFYPLLKDSCGKEESRE